MTNHLAMRDDLPRTDLYDYQEECGEGHDLNFRLIYRGKLPSGSNDSRSREKQLIRKCFHGQLKELYNTNPALRWQMEEPIQYVEGVGPKPIIQKLVTDDTGYPTWVQRVAALYDKHGYNFVPLVRRVYGVTCSLDILFLRRDDPGGLIRSGGDIDNRIKVLLDGLKMPSNRSELGGLEAEDDERPFHCLLEDDSLISSVRVTTDRLLLPLESDERINDVYLVIRVKTKVVNPSAQLADYGLG